MEEGEEKVMDMKEEEKMVEEIEKERVRTTTGRSGRKKSEGSSFCC